MPFAKMILLMKMQCSSRQRAASIILFSIFVVISAPVFGLEAEEKSPREPSAPIGLKKEPLNWNALRDAQLLKVKEDREISKNARGTRRFVERSESNRSRLGQAILTKGSWLRAETQHFYIFHKEEDRNIAAALGSDAENMLARAATVLGDTPVDWPEKAEVNLFRDEEFWRNTERTNAFHPQSFSFPDELEIYIRPVEIGDVKSAEAHHITHLLLGQYVEMVIRAGAPIPAWLGEGLAEQVCCQEENTKRLKDLNASDETWPLIRLLTTSAAPMGKEGADVFQAEASALIGFILETIGEKGLREFVDLLFSSGVPYAYATDTSPTAERARFAFEFLIQNTALHEKYATLEDFEKGWKSSFRD